MDFSLEDIMKERERRKYNALELMFPATGEFNRSLYPKHMKFFELGKTYDERLLLGGNRVGKSYSGLYETVLHMTGLYPKWWNGRRFDEPIRVWVAGITAFILWIIYWVKVNEFKIQLSAPYDANQGQMPTEADWFNDSQKLEH